jgi:putative lipoprotein
MSLDKKFDHKEIINMLRNLIVAASALTLFIGLAACSGEQATPATGAGTDSADGASMSTQKTSIAAELFYRERIALPPGAVAVAVLEIADSSTVVAETRDELADKSVPVSVTLDVDPQQLPQDAGLVFRGSIEVDGAPVWKSEPQPVDLTSATIDLGSVMLRAVEVPEMTDVNTPAASSLAGTWVVEDILGGGIIDSSRVTLNFSAQRVAGQASCNSYQGTWSLEDGQLSIGDVAVTMMACPDAIMNQERRFLDAIAAADGMRFDETGALFLTSDGDDLLRAYREG